MYVCMYVYMYVCMYISTYIYKTTTALRFRSKHNELNEPQAVILKSGESNPKQK